MKVSIVDLKTNAMTCKLVHKNIIGYIENILPAEQNNEIKKHIGSCPACNKLYMNVGETYTAYTKIANPELNPYFFNKLERKLKLKLQPELLSLSRLVKLQPIAATILIIVGICLGILMGKSLSSAPLTLEKLNRSEVIEAYASDYYLISSADENMDALLTNE